MTTRRAGKLTGNGKIAVIGSDNIDADDLIALGRSPFVRELILLDNGRELLRKELTILGEFGSRPTNIHRGTIADALGSQITVIAAGSDSVEETYHAVCDIADRFRKGDFSGVVLVVSNPIDLMTTAFQQASGLPASKVVGLAMPGNSNDPATWCTGRSPGIAFVDVCTPECPHFVDVAHESAEREPVNFSGMATCVKRICEAVLGDERIVLPVSTMAAGQYGIEGVCVGMPCVIGRHGVEEIPVLHSETEVELRRTAEWTRTAYDKLMSNTIAASVTG